AALVPTLMLTGRALQLVAGIALVVGWHERLAALLLAGFLIPATLTAHDFWASHGPELQGQLVNFLKNVAMFGGLCSVAFRLPAPCSAAPTGPPQVSPDESVLSEYNPEAPPNPNPPPYTLLRFNEDYTYLADPRNRTDPFDPVKYIALDPDDPKTYLSFGGELRERFEHFTNPGFGVPPNPDDDDYLRQRIAIHGDLHLTEHFRV